MSGPGHLDKSALVPDERDSLFFLVFLYMRIGKLTEAKSILTALKQACPGERRTGKYLAAIALEEEDGKTALTHLAGYLARNRIEPDDAPLLLMQAKSQWLLGNADESRAVLNEYLSMSGETT